MPTTPRLPPDLLRDAPAGRTWVGLSGGLDSTVLLHLLASDPDVRARGLRALHVHHGLHPDADAWAAHCEATCTALGVPLDVVRVCVVPDGDGPEAAARAARHAAYAAVLGGDEAMALAHHLDDQAETFLLRALRASGPDGLAAMPAWRRCGRGWLWRPLLAMPRDVLLAHARAHGLAWLEDPSNDDTALDRNFLRQRVLPLLRERWPGAGAAFARSAALCGEAAALLADGDGDALAAATRSPGVLSRAALAALPPARRARVLRRWIAALGLPPLPAGGVARIEQALARDAPASGDACFAWQGVEVRAWRDGLHAGRAVEPLPDGWSAAWDGLAPLVLPDGRTLRLDPPRGFDAPVVVRTRRGGERITLPGRTHSHALKHVLQDAGIPPWERPALPLLLDADGNVLAAGDAIVAAPLHAWLARHAARLACPR